MTSPRVAVLRAPGTNCDYETAYAFELAGAKAERIHLFRLLEEPRLLLNYQILCVPGGFSYGDDIGSGVIFASHLRNRLAGVLKDFLQGDRLCLGICNGFQAILKAGILPDGQLTPLTASAEADVAATLTWNHNGKYTARWVHLRTAGSSNVFLRGIQALDLPIAHAEGRIVVRDASVIEQWKQNRQLALCYSQPKAVDINPVTATLAFPDNPNGSVANLAGLSDPSGRILGLMPHPERFLFRTQHPNWTRLDLPEEGAGLQLFRNAVAYFG